MNQGLSGMLIPSIIAVSSAAVLFILRSIAFRFLHKWTMEAETRTGDVIASAFRVPSVYWCIAIGLYSGLTVSELPPKYVFYLSRVIHVIIVLSITFATANLSGNILSSYIQKSNLPLPPTGLVYGVLKGTILVVGVLVILGMLGISITPLITALGIGGLAVALALKDSLENLFAGIHLLIERSMRIGDLIRLESGQEGYIEDITWRTTRIRMLPNNMVIIPNSKLTQSIVTNYYLPDKTISLAVPVLVAHDADIEKAERVLTDVARKAAGEVDGLLSGPEPSVVLAPGLREGALEFTLNCQVREYLAQGPVQHELRKRILKRFREEGIEAPIPGRVVYLKKESETAHAD